MTNYNTPEIEVVEISKTDVITASLTLPSMPLGEEEESE